MKPIPRTQPCERFAALREAFDRDGFINALQSAGALVRLDERGGQDEPVPWAFRGSGLPLPDLLPEETSDGGDAVFLDRDPGGTTEGAPERVSISVSDSTVTGPAFSLSIPPARGRATAHLVPRQAEIVVGRDAKCDVHVRERSVSKRHARIELDDASITVVGRPGGRPRPNVFLIDLSSRNGTKINGGSMTSGVRHVLQSGDVVDLGDVALMFLDPGAFYDGLPRICAG